MLLFVLTSFLLLSLSSLLKCFSPPPHLHTVLPLTAFPSFLITLVFFPTVLVHVGHSDGHLARLLRPSAATTTLLCGAIVVLPGELYLM